MKINKLESRLAKESLSLKYNPLNNLKARLRCLDAEYNASIKDFVNKSPDSNQSGTNPELY